MSSHAHAVSTGVGTTLASTTVHPLNSPCQGYGRSAEKDCKKKIIENYKKPVEFSK